MPNNVKHFSINADDVPRAKSFLSADFWLAVHAVGPTGLLLNPNRYGRRSRTSRCAAGTARDRERKTDVRIRVHDRRGLDR